MSVKFRPGYHKIPRWVFQANSLNSDERFLLMYFDSHNQTSWEHHEHTVLADLGWGRQKYFNIRRSLVNYGLLRTEIVRKRDAKNGKFVPTGFRAFTDLSADNHNLDHLSDCRISSSSKSSPISTSINKRHSTSEVIEVVRQIRTAC